MNPPSHFPDAVIVGGGVIGASIAHFLSKAGLSVTLVEKGGIASGTSGRCEGNVLVNDKTPGYDCQLARLSQNLFPLVAAELDEDIEWRQTGSLLVAENDEELEAAATFCHQMTAEGIAVRLLDHAEIHGDMPHLADDIPGGLEFASDGALNPMALARGLVRDARKRGATVWTGAAVTGIHPDKRHKTFRVATARGDLFTPRVINAAGVWSPEIGKFVGLEIPVRPRQGQILVTERTLEIARRAVIEFGYLMAKFGKAGYHRKISPEMEQYGIALVLEPTGAGNFLVGSCRQFAGMKTTVDLPVLRALAQRAIRFFPVVRHIHAIRSYAGLRPFTPDHFPIISETRIPGFYVAAGHEGDGIGLSLITGKLMMQIVTNQPTDISVAPLRLDRFAAECRPSDHA
ncbi:MAG: NAD(P)/FAD-dependent oxidoreductase [Desulfatirhabdiaceae bacterium]